MLYDYVLARLKEPSTWAGFASLAVALGVAAPTYAAFSAVGVAVAGFLAVIMKD
jgi:hypothetical protein